MNTHNIKTAKDAYLYASEVIKDRWLEGEAIIVTMPFWSYKYARDVIKGRWIEGEAIIATDPCWSYYYASEVIKDRWLEGELIIMFSKYATGYAKLCGIN